MKDVIRLFTLLLLPFSIMGQESNHIHGNNIYAGMSAYGQVGQAYEQYFQFGLGPQSGANFPPLIACTYFQASGYDDSQSLRFTNDTAGFTLANSSPLDQSTGEPIDDTGVFHRVWKVYRQEVLDHIADFNDNGQIDNTIPDNIRQWPGIGNSFYTTSVPITQTLAPYRDVNDDGIYNPLDGDYPILEMHANEQDAVIPNEMIFAVFNDMGNVNSLGIEIHQMMFSFNCDTLTELNNTIFLRKKIINRSTRNYTDMSIGTLIDFELGCPENDLSGTASDINTTYVYNETFDRDGDLFGNCATYGYDNMAIGWTPGAFAATILSHPMDACISINRMLPTEDKYDLTSAINRHQLMHGIACRQNGTCDTTYFSFTDYPVNSDDGNHMVNLGRETHNFMFPSTVLGSFNSQESVELDYSFYHTRDVDLTSWQSAEQLQYEVPIIQSYYDQGFPITCSQRIIEDCVDECVRPGDANADGVVLGDDYLAMKYGTLNNIQGPSRNGLSSIWYGHNAETWPQNYNSGTINTKHLDFNGTGHSGGSGFYRNYRKTKAGVEEPALIPTLPANNNIDITPLSTRINENSSIFLKRIFNIAINIDFPENESILGISFSLVIDTTLYEFNFSDDVYNADYMNMAMFSEENRVDYFITAENGQLEDGRINMGPHYLSLNPDLRVPDGQDSLYIPFPMYNLRAITTDGDYIDIGAKTDSIWLIRDFSSVNDQQKPIDVSIYPNPASSYLTIKSSSPLIGIRMYSTEGKLVQQIEIPNGSWEFNMSTDQLPAGMYIAVLEYDVGITHKKIIFARN